MKSLGLSLLALGLVLAFVPQTGAQETGQTAFTLVTHTEGSGGYFALEGQTAKNPTLVVPANSQITITLKAGDGNGAHNICFVKSSADSCSDYVSLEGDNATLTFDSGSAGGSYFCAPHMGTGMTGTVRIAGATTTTDDGEDKDSPGLGVIGVVVAMAGAVLLFRRR